MKRPSIPRLKPQRPVEAAALGAGAAILANPASVRATPAADRVVYGVIGIRGRGYAVGMNFAKRDDCHAAWLADVDTTLFDSEASKGYQSLVPEPFRGPRAGGFAKSQQDRRPSCTDDYRRILDDKSVDTVIVATPDHWHVMATVHACQAGKDVYVEKPLSHNAWEGQQAVAAARKYDRVVQVGTQNRSAPYNWDAKRFIEEGRLGEIHLCRTYTQRYWGNFDMEPPGDPPEGLHWDMWNGPARGRRYSRTWRNRWHHFWDYSGGDIINDGIHTIDLARWLCGKGLPRSAYAVGQRYAEPGAAETPDTQTCIWQYDDMLMSYELTLYTRYMLKIDRGVRESDLMPYWMQCGTRIELFGTKGLMMLGRQGGGWQVFIRPKDRKPVVDMQRYGRFPDDAHIDNFLQCVRSRKRPNADVEEGHVSALLAHYANMSMRIGGAPLEVDPESQHVDNAEAMKLFRRDYRKPYVLADVT